MQGRICEDKGQQEHWRHVSPCATVTSDAWVHAPPPMKDKNQWIGNAFFSPSFLHRWWGSPSRATRTKTHNKQSVLNFSFGPDPFSGSVFSATQCFLFISPFFFVFRWPTECERGGRRLSFYRVCAAAHGWFGSWWERGPAGCQAALPVADLPPVGGNDDWVLLLSSVAAESWLKSRGWRSGGPIWVRGGRCYWRRRPAERRG